MGGVRVALALGSGGARGYAHIGVIQVLEERGADIVGIAGSSMGALVGAVRAAGKLAEYAEWATSMSQLDVLRMLDVSLTAPGAIRASKILGKVHELLDGALIEDLPIPYTAVATDLASRREVWFQRGPVEVAVRASIAIPGIFTPVMLNGRLLVDGAVTDPVPIAPTIAAGAELTVGVSLSGDRRGGDGAPATVSAEPKPFEEWSERFRRGASFLLDRDLVRSLLSRFGRDHVPDAAGDVVAEDAVDVLPSDLSKYDVMSQSLDVMQQLLARYRLAAYPPDVLVTIPKDVCRTFDFHRAPELIEIGREQTIAVLDQAGVLPRRDVPPPAPPPVPPPDLTATDARSPSPA